MSVRIITKKRIKEANSEHSEWKASLESWHKIAKAADWKNFPGVKQSWRNVDLVGICVVFDIATIGRDWLHTLIINITWFLFGSSSGTQNT